MPERRVESAPSEVFRRPKDGRRWAAFDYDARHLSPTLVLRREALQPPITKPIRDRALVGRHHNEQWRDSSCSHRRDS